MISWFSRHQKPLFIATVSIFLVGTFVGLGGYLLTNHDSSGAVASVGSAKIPYSIFLARVNQYTDVLRNRGTDVSDQVLGQIKQEMLREMIVEYILAQKAKEMGLKVTDAELAQDIESTPAFQRDGVFNQQLYFYAVRSVYHDTPTAYETMRRRQILSARFRQMIYETVKLVPGEVRQSYAAAHKGSLKKFAQERADFTSKLRETRAIDILNYYLRQLTSQIVIRSYLKAREPSA
jgi:peptidyl-prolyl cis-trans isomerase D